MPFTSTIPSTPPKALDTPKRKPDRRSRRYNHQSRCRVTANELPEPQLAIQEQPSEAISAVEAADTPDPILQPAKWRNHTKRSAMSKMPAEPALGHDTHYFNSQQTQHDSLGSDTPTHSQYLGYKPSHNRARACERKARHYEKQLINPAASHLLIDCRQVKKRIERSGKGTYKEVLKSALNAAAEQGGSLV